MAENLGTQLGTLLSDHNIDVSARDFLAGLRSRLNVAGQWPSVERAIMEVTSLERHQVRPIMDFVKKNRLVEHNGKQAGASRWAPLSAFDELEKSLVPPPGAIARLHSLAGATASQASELMTTADSLRGAVKIVELFDGDIEVARQAAAALLNADI